MDKDTQLRLERGREYYANREYDKAEPYLLKVADLEIGFADVMNMLGVIYHDRGQVGLAQEYFEKAIRLNPRYTEAALNLSVTYNEQGMYEQANRIHEHVTTISAEFEKEIEPFARGKLTNMHADLGQAYAELQMFNRAIEQYNQALELSPNFADIRTRLGQILRDAGMHEEAKAQFEKVKAERPGYVPALISLGATHFAVGDKTAARREWKAALEADPQNRTAGMYLRMVDQMIAQEEADADGIHLEVESPVDAPARTPGRQDELSFDFEGQKAAVASVIPPPPRKGDGEDDA